jgi:hypothetical protein
MAASAMESTAQKAFIGRQAPNKHGRVGQIISDSKAHIE